MYETQNGLKKVGRSCTRNVFSAKNQCASTVPDFGVRTEFVEPVIILRMARTPKEGQNVRESEREYEFRMLNFESLAGVGTDIINIPPHTLQHFTFLCMAML